MSTLVINWWCVRVLSCGKCSSVSQELTAFAIRVDWLAFHTKCRVDHARTLVGQWELGWKSGVQKNKWGPLKELVMSGVNHCFSNLGSLFISCERLFSGSPLPFFLFFSPVSLTWEPLSFPPRTRSLYTLRPTTKVLLQVNFWKTLGQEGSCPCWS